MNFTTAASMREADRRTMERPETSGMFLMFHAGAAVARAADHLARLCGMRRIVCVAGKGNNGGDASVAARMLLEMGYSVHLLLAADPSSLKGDAARAFEWMAAVNVPYTSLPDPEMWKTPEMMAGTAVARGVVVDGVLGTGGSGAPRGTPLEAIRWIQARRPASRVLSIDLPSGLNADTGDAPGETVTADWTVTLCRPKCGFLASSARKYVGHLSVADIGMPPEIADDPFSDGAIAADGLQLMAGPEIRAAFPARPPDSHKGTFGRLLILGGSVPYPHAPVIAAAGARAGGIGLLTLGVPNASRSAAATHVPEAMIREMPLAGNGLSMASDALPRTSTDLSRFDVVLIGPGLTREDAAAELLGLALHQVQGKLVLDADALALLAKIGKLPQDVPASRQRILTPHLGEAAMLLGCAVSDIRNAPQAAAREIASRYQSTVVLKSHATLVFGKGKMWINLTGNPGMSTGGMGDLLSGLIAAYWAQIPDPEQAAISAVWAHGRAGDFAAFHGGQLPLSPFSLLPFLSEAD